MKRFLGSPMAKFRAGLAVGVLCVIAGGTSSAGAAEPVAGVVNGSALAGSVDGANGVVGDLPDLPAPVIGDGLTEAELTDLAFIAAQSHESLTSTIARVGRQQDFAMLATDLAATFPDDFAGARIEQGGNPWIAFRGRVPSAAADAIEAFDRSVLSQRAFARADGKGYAIDLRAGRGFSQAELDSRLTKVHYAVMDARDVVANASSSYDLDTGEITVQVQPSVAYAGVGELEIVSALKGRGIDLAGTRITIVAKVESTSEVLYGGQAMSTCTSAFGVTLNGTTDGVLTAGHCGNSQSQAGSSLTFQAEHEGTWGDFQWHTSTGTEADDFFAGNLVTNATDLRDVSGVGSAVEGQDLCRNGVTTRKNCDTVYQLNHCVGNTCHLTAMNHDTGASGDSGGPYYWGNVAYGVHKGEKYWFGYRDVFSPQQYVDDAFPGLVVATT